MSNPPWDAPASVYRYPPLSAYGASDPIILHTGTIRACLQMVAALDEIGRLNVEIETSDGETLYNGVDIERMIADGVQGQA